MKLVKVACRKNPIFSNGRAFPSQLTYNGSTQADLHLQSTKHVDGPVYVTP